MLTVQNITHRYGRSPALSGVSLALAKGETLGLLGQNGAGKSTLLKIITGYIAPSEGVVKVAGQDINRHPAVRGEIGYLPEKPPLYDDMRVDEQLVYLARLKGLPRRKAHSEAAVLTEKLGLGPVSRRLTGNLSKGYRQRVGLAGALIGDPPLLVLDEPTSGLDPGQRQVFARLVEELAPRHAIIISSHIVSEVRTLSSRLAILHQGRLVADGEPYKLEAGLG
ncbi:MAG: ABC transporter ATP-binding protein, partial [Planctomycetota bacterium]|nr:ABC transporter ATP-binding protein [Planctomycetota bacterium]